MLMLVVVLSAVAVILLGALLVIVWNYSCYRESHPFTREDRERAREQTRKLTVATRAGLTVEQLAPYLPGFRFNPRDAHFIGDPIDLVIFDGLDEGDLREIVLVEVKSGAKRLNARQRRVREAIHAGRVGFEILHQPVAELLPDDTEPAAGPAPERHVIKPTESGFRIIQLPRRGRRLPNASPGA